MPASIRHLPKLDLTLSYAEIVALYNDLNEGDRFYSPLDLDTVCNRFNEALSNIGQTPDIKIWQARPGTPIYTEYSNPQIFVFIKK